MRKYMGKIVFVFFLIVLGMSAAAQQRIVIGKVTDSEGKAISGASVYELDADGRIVNGSTTDIEGKFSLKNVNPKNKISVSMIGYKTFTIGASSAKSSTQ